MKLNDLIIPIMSLTIIYLSSFCIIKTMKIQRLEDIIANQRSIEKWQESVMRDCGFYGKEP